MLSTKLSDLEASDLYKSYKFSFEETKISREEIEEKNAHRTDLINSMQETENELSEVLTTFLILEKQARIFSSSSNSLEQLNLELKFRIKQLENEIESNNF